MTLDLQSIKSRLAATTPGRWYREVTGVAHGGVRTEKTWLFADDGATEADAELVACAKEDLAALVAEVERLQKVCAAVLEASPVVLRSATFNGQRLKLTRELWLPIRVVQDKANGVIYLEVDDPELGLCCRGRTRGELIDEIEEQIHVMYFEYALAEPEELTPKAQAARLIWRDWLRNNPEIQGAPHADQA